MDYGGEGKEGYLQQRKCRREMRDQERENVKSSEAILEWGEERGVELNDRRGCGLTTSEEKTKWLDTEKVTKRDAGGRRKQL